MSEGILLDTSVVIPHLRGRFDIAKAAPPTETWYLPLTVVGELYKGVFRSSRENENLRLLEAFLKTVGILHPDTATAIQYAKISASLQVNGTPLPENDVWIAAMALECGMPLATRDAHFAHVSGLKILSW